MMDSIALLQSDKTVRLSPIVYRLSSFAYRLSSKMRRITLLTNPDVCNLHCPLCFLNQRASGCREFGMGEMHIATALAAIEKYAAERDALGKCILREVIPSTMGEPLLYSHFDELLEVCESLGIPLNLTTNGTFPGKWGSDAGMAALLHACSDIKISYLASEQFDDWNANVEKLLDMRKKLCERDVVRDVVRDAANLANVSIQVTLHRKNLQNIPELVLWASSIGIDRIKWNPVVFLNVAPAELKREYALNCELDEIRHLILDVSESCHSNLKNEGSLFMNMQPLHPSKLMEDMSAEAFSRDAGTCPFADEIWILPDGSEDYCPSPERRYGDKNAMCCFIK